MCSLREKWQSIRRNAFRDLNGLLAYDGLWKEGPDFCALTNPRYKQFYDRAQYLLEGLEQITRL